VPAGHLTPLDIVNNNPNSPRFQRIPGLSSYPGFPELIQRNPPKVLRAAQLLAEGDSQAAFALVRGILKPSELAQVAGVPMFAEPGRFPLAGVTGRLGFQQAEYSPDPGAVIAGLPGGEVGAQEPAQRMSRRLRQQAELSDRGSQYAARLEASVIRRERFSEIPREERAAMSEAERRQHLAPSREEVELLRPHHVSERSLANKMLQLLGRAGILDGLVTEPGGKPRQEALLRKRIRDFLESS
jgi:hypothetical protein